MLRSLVILLLLANLAFWGYTQGHLAWLGWAPAPTGEPQRLAQQVAPEALTVLNAHRGNAPEAAALPAAAADTAGPTAEAAAAAPAASAEPVPPPPPAETPPPAAPTGCWQLGGFTENQTVLLRGALASLADLQGRWTLEASVLPARWIVYLGKFSGAEALQRRRAELRQAGIDHRDVNVAALQPGLALGTYSTEEAARRALADVRRKGVDNARVVQERDETKLYTLRLPAATDGQRRLVDSLGVLGGKSLQRCP